MNFMTQWEPRRELNRLTNEMDRLLGELTGRTSGQESVVTAGWAPAVDIRETKNAIEITAELPGMDPADIEVTVENGVLSIRGQRTFEKSTEDATYHRMERGYGMFERRFSLPRSVDAGHIDAKFRHGLLTLTVPKREEAMPRSVKVNVESR